MDHKFKTHVAIEDAQTQNLLLSWRSIFAGVLISLLTYMILTALGAGIGGMTAANLIANESSGAGLATGAGLWMGISMVISLFVGSFLCVRITKFQTQKVGITHGIVISAVFFLLLIWGTGSAIGGVAKGFGKMAQSVGTGASNLSANPAVQDSLQKAMGNAPLKSEPDEVAQGLATRLFQGDTASVKNYLAYQTGLSETEVNAKVDQLKTDFDLAIKQAGEKAAMAIADAGWTLFVTFVVGLLGAMMGGKFGAHANEEKPLARYTPAENFKRQALV